MFTLAFLIAIYAYLIFFLGLLGLLYKSVIVGLMIVFLIFSGIVAVFPSRVCYFFPSPPRSQCCHLGGVFRLFWRRKLSIFALVLLTLQVLVNLIGALGPELSFDALWYHLTLPKIYLQDHQVHFIPGGLFYYSGSPQLVEMLYIAALSLGGVILAKLVHFLFGIGCLFAIYKLLRKFLSYNLSLLGCLIFYSQLVVGWLSTTAYTDLVLVFFVNLGFLTFLNWWKTKKINQLIESGLLFGLASAVKLTGLYVSLSIIFIFLLKILLDRTRRILFKQILVFCLAILLPLLPWFCFAYFNTGKPVYPYLTNWFFQSQTTGLSMREWLLTRHPMNLIKVLWQTTFTKGDILTPIILIGLPIVLYSFGFLRHSRRVHSGRRTSQPPLTGAATPGEASDNFFLSYLGFNFFFWFLTPLNYSRFLLPLVPIFILVLLIKLDKFRSQSLIFKTFTFAVFLIAFLNIGARSLSNKKFIPFILDQQTEAEFMEKYLNFKAGNFYDLDGFFKKRVGNKKVLVIGIHNLFYLDFPFKEISYVQKEDRFDYLLVGRDIDKNRFQKLPLVYKNEKVGVSLYKAKIQF